MIRTYDMTREKLFMEGKIDAALALVRAELIRAIDKHPTPMRSPHEAYGVVAEEVHEFFLEMIANNRALQTKEMIQVGAMACRFIVDLAASDVAAEHHATGVIGG